MPSQSIFNTAARVILLKYQSDHIISLLTLLEALCFTQSKSQSHPIANKAPQDLSPLPLISSCSLVHSTPATLFPGLVRHTPTSEPLSMLLPLPNLPADYTWLAPSPPPGLYSGITFGRGTPDHRALNCTLPSLTPELLILLLFSSTSFTVFYHFKNCLLP